MPPKIGGTFRLDGELVCTYGSPFRNSLMGTNLEKLSLLCGAFQWKDWLKMMEFKPVLWLLFVDWASKKRKGHLFLSFLLFFGGTSINLGAQNWYTSIKIDLD